MFDSPELRISPIRASSLRRVNRFEEKARAGERGHEPECAFDSGSHARELPREEAAKTRAAISAGAACRWPRATYSR